MASTVEPVLVIAPAAIAATAALVGIWLGGRSTAWANERRWRLEERRNAYLAYTEAFSAELDALRRLHAATTEGDAARADLERSNLNEALHRRNGALPALVLLASRPVLDAMAVEEEILEEWRPFVSDSAPPIEFGHLLAKGADGRSRLLNVCRRDLGFPHRDPLHTRAWDALRSRTMT